MIMGGAIASVCFNVQLKHPTKECSLINYGTSRPTCPISCSLQTVCSSMFSSSTPPRRAPSSTMVPFSLFSLPCPGLLLA